MIEEKNENKNEKINKRKAQELQFLKLLTKLFLNIYIYTCP
jgi:hypothetical protein